MSEVEMSPPTSTKRKPGRPKGALLRVACPTCEAPVDVQCVSAVGKVVAGGHAARRALAGIQTQERRPPKRTRALQELLGALTDRPGPVVVTVHMKTPTGHQTATITADEVKVQRNGDVLLVGARVGDAQAAGKP